MQKRNKQTSLKQANRLDCFCAEKKAKKAKSKKSKTSIQQTSSAQKQSNKFEVKVNFEHKMLTKKAHDAYPELKKQTTRTHI